MAEVATIIGLCLCSLLGLVLTALRLPGTWLIVVTAGVYGWWTGWERLTPWWLATIVGLAVLGEIIELLASVFTTRRAGASRQAGWGGLIGGIVGMILFTIPVPIIGTIIGALLGCFAGAALAEFVFASNRTDAGTPRSFSAEFGESGARSVKVGFFAAAGFVLGTVAKTAIALVLTGLLLTAAVCSHTPTP